MIRLPNNNGVWVTGPGAEPMILKPRNIRVEFHRRSRTVSLDQMLDTLEDLPGQLDDWQGDDWLRWCEGNHRT
jgi:hypothetical protein